MKKFFEEFKKFISKGNVVDMAVGVAVASAFTAIVKAFTNGFISPLLALLSNGSELSELKYVIREAKVVVDDTGAEVVEVAEVAILWGAFLQAIFDFLIIAFALFIMIKVAAQLSKKTKELSDKVKAKMLEEELAAEKQRQEEERIKAEEEARIAEEKAAEEAARIEAEKQAERDRLLREEALLTEIRDLLRSSQK